MKNIIIKNSSNNVIKELNSIGFDMAYLETASNKYTGYGYKIFNLKPYEANILKQLCLSLGFDCAVNRQSVTCNCEYTDCLIFASISQLKKLISKLKMQPFKLKETALKLEEIIDFSLPPLTIGKYTFDWTKPYIMGILNVTPDSFSDGGKYSETDNAFNHVLNMINDGADIIDIGGESTRPGADCIPANEEIKRVIPIIKTIRQQNIDIPISIDTRNFETAKAAIEAGANIINDVSGLDYDTKLFNFTTENNIPVVIMHSDKVPAVSGDFSSNDIIEEVYFSLYKKIINLKNAGMDKSNIIIDVGIGFGKSLNSNFELLKRLSEFKSLNQPILLGLSRKSFIRNSFNINCNDADIPTAFYSAMITSANIHRVHNVKLTKQYLDYGAKLL